MDELCGRKFKLAHQFLVFGLCVAGSIVTPQAFAADNLYDGTYRGPKTVTYGTALECGSDGEASITILDGGIQYGFGAFPLKMKVAQGGTFKGRARKGNRGGGQAMHANGKISNSNIEADFIVNGVHGHVCSYHWTLKRI